VYLLNPLFVIKSYTWYLYIVDNSYMNCLTLARSMHILPS